MDRDDYVQFTSVRKFWIQQYEAAEPWEKRLAQLEKESMSEGRPPMGASFDEAVVTAAAVATVSALPPELHKRCVLQLLEKVSKEQQPHLRDTVCSLTGIFGVPPVNEATPDLIGRMCRGPIPFDARQPALAEALSQKLVNKCFCSKSRLVSE